MMAIIKFAIFAGILVMVINFGWLLYINTHRRELAVDLFKAGKKMPSWETGHFSSRRASFHFWACLLACILGLISALKTAFLFPHYSGLVEFGETAVDLAIGLAVTGGVYGGFYLCGVIMGIGKLEAEQDAIRDEAIQKIKGLEEMVGKLKTARIVNHD